MAASGKNALGLQIRHRACVAVVVSDRNKTTAIRSIALVPHIRFNRWIEELAAAGTLAPHEPVWVTPAAGSSTPPVVKTFLHYRVGPTMTVAEDDAVLRAIGSKSQPEYFVGCPAHADLADRVAKAFTPEVDLADIASAVGAALLALEGPDGSKSPPVEPPPVGTRARGATAPRRPPGNEAPSRVNSSGTSSPGEMDRSFLLAAEELVEVVADVDLRLAATVRDLIRRLEESGADAIGAQELIDLRSSGLLHLEESEAHASDRVAEWEAGAQLGQVLGTCNEMPALSSLPLSTVLPLWRAHSKPSQGDDWKTETVHNMMDLVALPVWKTPAKDALTHVHLWESAVNDLASCTGGLREVLHWIGVSEAIARHGRIETSSQRAEKRPSASAAEFGEVEEADQEQAGAAEPSLTEGLEAKQITKDPNPPIEVTRGFARALEPLIARAARCIASDKFDAEVADRVQGQISYIERFIRFPKEDRALPTIAIELAVTVLEAEEPQTDDEAFRHEMMTSIVQPLAELDGSQNDADSIKRTAVALDAAIRRKLDLGIEPPEEFSYVAADPHDVVEEGLGWSEAAGTVLIKGLVHYGPPGPVGISLGGAIGQWLFSAPGAGAAAGGGIGFLVSIAWAMLTHYRARAL